MSFLLQSSDFIIGTSHLGILIELVYLNRYRREFSLDALYWILILFFMGSTLFFFISTLGFDPRSTFGVGAESLLSSHSDLSMLIISGISAVAVLWFAQTVARIKKLPSVQEAQRWNTRIAEEMAARKALEIELRATILNLQKAQTNAVEAAILANLHHAAKVPLGAIMGFAEILRGRDVSPADQIQYLDIIYRNSRLLESVFVCLIGTKPTGALDAPERPSPKACALSK